MTTGITGIRSHPHYCKHSWDICEFKAQRDQLRARVEELEKVAKLVILRMSSNKNYDRWRTPTELIEAANAALEGKK